MFLLPIVRLLYRVAAKLVAVVSNRTLANLSLPTRLLQEFHCFITAYFNKNYIYIYIYYCSANKSSFTIAIRPRWYWQILFLCHYIPVKNGLLLVIQNFALLVIYTIFCEFYLYVIACDLCRGTMYRLTDCKFQT